MGGDFYDCFMLDRRRLFFVVADVSGKGLPAALFMASAKSHIKSTALRESDVGEALTREERAVRRPSATRMNGRLAPTPDGLAEVAVSLVHGCALQAVIDPKAFSVQQHFGSAARMLDGHAAGALAR